MSLKKLIFDYYYGRMQGEVNKVHTGVFVSIFYSLSPSRLYTVVVSAKQSVIGTIHVDR